MTEVEWLNSTDPKAMIAWLASNGIVGGDDLRREDSRNRSLELYSVACCHRIWHLLTDERLRQAVQWVEHLVEERFADLDAEAVEAVMDALRSDSMQNMAANEDAWYAVDYLTWLAGDSSRVSVAHYVTRTASDAACTAKDAEYAAQCDLLRDIFGNRFHSVILDPESVTPRIVVLAQSIYNEGRFDRMPELADALEVAGCTNEEILEHCRATVLHVRGCWALDVILGKNRKMTDEDKLRANAATAVSTLAPLSDVNSFGFNRDSVAWVEGYIERQRIRPELSPETRNGLVSVLGSFLGECMIHCHGGEWRRDECGWGIQFGDGNVAYPFNKVGKQFDNGVEGGDSILSFLDSTAVLFKPKIDAVKQRKPWWRFG